MIEKISDERLKELISYHLEIEDNGIEYDTGTALQELLQYRKGVEQIHYKVGFYASGTGERPYLKGLRYALGELEREFPGLKGDNAD